MFLNSNIFCIDTRLLKLGDDRSLSQDDTHCLVLFISLPSSAWLIPPNNFLTFLILELTFIFWIMGHGESQVKYICPKQTKDKYV